MIPLYIPTRGRVSRQVTWDNFPKSLKAHAILVCPESEVAQHQQRGRLTLACPAQEQGLSPTLQWIQDYAREHGQEKIVTVDDDIIFQHRISDTDVHLRKATDVQVEELFETIDIMLENFTLVGVSHRNGNNRSPEEICLCERQTNVHGTRPFEIHRLGIKYSDVPVQQDFHMTLSLLRKGHPNAVLYKWAQSDLPPGTPGGCALYRTPEMMEANAHVLANLHQGFVTPVQKETEWKDVGGGRWDVRIAWKKAYQSSGGIKQ